MVFFIIRVEIIAIMQIYNEYKKNKICAAGYVIG